MHIYKCKNVLTSTVMLFNVRHDLPSSSPPVQAAQPIIGGMAPTNDPTHVLMTLMRFSGVYISVYRPRLNAPKPATTGLTP